MALRLPVARDRRLHHPLHPRLPGRGAGRAAARRSAASAIGRSRCGEFQQAYRSQREFYRSLYQGRLDAAPAAAARARGAGARGPGRAAPGRAGGRAARARRWTTRRCRRRSSTIPSSSESGHFIGGGRGAAPARAAGPAGCRTSSARCAPAGAPAAAVGGHRRGRGLRRRGRPRVPPPQRAGEASSTWRSTPPRCARAPADRRRGPQRFEAAARATGSPSGARSPTSPRLRGAACARGGTAGRPRGLLPQHPRPFRRGAAGLRPPRPGQGEGRSRRRRSRRGRGPSPGPGSARLGDPGRRRLRRGGAQGVRGPGLGAERRRPRLLPARLDGAGVRDRGLRARARSRSPTWSRPATATT